MKKCFFTYIDKMNFVKIATDNMGYGSVNCGEKWYKFNFFEYDCERVGLDWEDESFKKAKSTMNILGRRLVVGEIIVYAMAANALATRLQA